MRQAVMTEPGKIEIGQAAEPKAGAGEILLRIKQIGVCGSDIHVNHGKHPFTSYPVVQGHEFSGEVVEVGEGVSGIKAGMKATARPQVVCGQCSPCKRGDYNICDVLRVEGFQAPGVAQDLFVTTSERIVPLPDSLSFTQGALVEPVSVGVHSTG
ncbi:MAG: alcohol dehydrogenase catalytic domain-containing protein, partial [Planctomycetota bacterium]